MLRFSFPKIKNIKGVFREKFPGRPLWQKIWGGQPPELLLLTIPVIVVAFMVIPLAYVGLRSLQAGTERWVKLLDTRIPQLLWNTMSLATVVTFLGIVLGVSLAWLVIRTDLPAKKYWQWLLAFPLLIPPYVGAMSYIMVFGPRGWVRDLFGTPLFNIYGFWSVSLIMTMFTYPYVFLITSAALKKLNMNYEEVGLSLGLSYREVYYRIILPLLRPAIGAGAILIALYVLSDFGGISMMRYTTFTAAIYFQIGSFDRETASVLSTVLISITLVFLYLEAKTREKQAFYQTDGTFRKPRIVELGKWKIPMVCYVIGIFLLAVVIPIGVLTYWSTLGIANGALNQRFWGFVWNSLLAAGLTAFLCMILSLPVVYLKSRYPSVASKMIEKIAYAGYALPGVIVALGIIFVFNQYIPVLYSTVAMVIMAYVMRFLPKSMQSQDAALKQVSPELDEAGRSLGYPPWKVITKIIFPLILPGILTGGALVFVSAIKELPTTLLLRPPGMDTLAVRIWIEASDYFYDLAAPAALLMILVSALPLKWMLGKY